jgi:hypothetical protein
MVMVPPSCGFGAMRDDRRLLMVDHIGVNPWLTFLRPSASPREILLRSLRCLGVKNLLIRPPSRAAMPPQKADAPWDRPALPKRSGVSAERRQLFGRYGGGNGVKGGLPPG